MKEKLKERIVEILREDNPGLLIDEAERLADRVMELGVYYQRAKESLEIY